MKKKRLIPVLLLKNGFLVQSRQFTRFQNLGNPITSVKRLSEWAADELIYLDITRDDAYDMHRDDLGHPNRDNILDIMSDFSMECHMPVVVGGKIRTLDDIRVRLRNGADKVAINTQAFDDPGFISASAAEFGSQCIVVSIDAKLTDGRYEVMIECGKRATGKNPVEWAEEAARRGAGEIFLNSINRDGSGKGYDIELIASVADAVKIPVIACGGAGSWDDMAEVLEKTSADGIAAANIFQHKDQSVYLAKKYLFERRYNLRSPNLLLQKEEMCI